MCSKHNVLEIVIPTYNHPEYIQTILKHLSKFETGEYDFILSVFDSSTNNKTEEIVNESSSDYVRYFRMDSSLDIDEKTILALKMAEADYIMLCGDGHCPEVDRIFEDINFRDTETEIYVLYDKKWRAQNKYFVSLNEFYFSSKDEFFKAHFWQLVLYGGSIIAKSLINKIDLDYVVSRFNGSGFIFPCALVIYSTGKYKALSDNFLFDVPEKILAGWMSSGIGIELWTIRYSEAVKKLAGFISDDTIESIIHTTGGRTKFLAAKGLMSFRTNGNYNYKIYKKYKKELKEYGSCSSFMLWLIAVIPSWCFKIIKKIYKIFR